MGSLLRIAIVLAAALGGVACSSAKPRPAGVPENPTEALNHRIKEFQVIWTRGGKLGYLKTYEVSRAEEKPVVMHYVEDLSFRTIGWYANDGQGERFDYPPEKEREARRTPFDRVELPLDSTDNQLRRILGVDPQAPIALRHAEEADLKR